MHVELLVLRVIHVLGGIFWLGSGLFTTFYFMPAMQEAGPAAGAIMVSLTRRRMFVVLPTVAIITMLAGIRLMMIASANYGGSYFASATGKTFSVSAVAAILAFLLSMIVARPAGVKSGKLAQQAAQDPGNRDRLMAEVAALTVRAKRASIVAMAFLVFAACGMAVARYL